jgi:hypothetical protein
MVDLNTLIPRATALQLNNAAWINDRGEITGKANPPGSPNDDSRILHPYVLIPCDENHPNIERCDYSLVAAIQSTQLQPSQNTELSAPAGMSKLSPAEMMPRFRSMMSNRYGRRR